MVKALLFVLLVVPFVLSLNTISSANLNDNFVWTEEEMQKAIPRGPILRNETGHVVGVVEQAQQTCRGTFSLYDSCSDPYYGVQAVGKVFFRLGTSNYVCSGSMGADNAVWTAGHCVYDQTEGFATSWIFVPHYCAGSGKQYSALSLHTTDGWINGDFEYDYAVVLFSAGTFSGQPQLKPYILSAPLSTTFLSQGYPQGSPFDGKFINTCDAVGCLEDPNSYPPRTIAIGCDSTGGSSGGPWVVNGDSIGSLNSYGYTTIKNRMYGPRFNQDTVTFYNEVQKNGEEF
eukprot:TRINITY_DN11151_c0_g1_i1.p1 TRINITY_DN11151_c0_g1~~TRINITY_DN11151_c0_g1_i1.p1  ORF type:complete len:287 (+),score=76.35 TRINITY_DN11151_c0_g1_i1:260-1120(+)